MGCFWWIRDMLVFIQICIKHDFVLPLKLNMVLEVGERSSFQCSKICNIHKFLNTCSFLPTFCIPQAKALSAGVLCTTYFDDNNFPATTPCLWHSNDACSFTANLTKSTLSFMNVMSDNGFLRSILSFWETQTLQIIVFCSVIISQSCFFFHYFNVETFGSFRICWAAELTTNEADADDRALSGALVTVIGKLLYKALMGNNEDEIFSELLTVQELLSGSPTVSDKIPFELLTNKELASQNPGGFCWTHFWVLLNFWFIWDLVGHLSAIFVN